MDPTGPIDQPPIPRPPRSRRALIWGGVIAVVLGAYAVAGFAGWDFGVTERDRVPPSARDGAGGYRSFHFWHSGFHGGK